MANLPYIAQYRKVSEEFAKDVFQLRWNQKYIATEKEIADAIKKIKESGLPPVTNDDLIKMFGTKEILPDSAFLYALEKNMNIP